MSQTYFLEHVNIINMMDSLFNDMDSFYILHEENFHF